MFFCEIVFWIFVIIFVICFDWIIIIGVDWVLNEDLLYIEYVKDIYYVI